MQRLRGDRGAIGVVVALLMVPILGFAAMTIDVAAMYAERQQLQTGADAGALAIAQDCGRGACGTPSQTAQEFATSNLDPNKASSTATVTSQTASQVTVLNAGVKQHWFAPVLGADPSSTITASATAGWGSPTGGTAVLPLAFSWCEWKKQTGGGLPSDTPTLTTIYLTKSSPSDGAIPDCTGPSGNLVPGGFGWLDPNAGPCQTSSTIDGFLWSKTGNSAPSGCDLTATLNQTILLPIFDEYDGSGTKAKYTVYGYAAFKMTGYNFSGDPYPKKNPPCKGSDRCIAGYFERFVDLSEAFTYGAGTPQLGASLVRLTQ
jgi:hypothetical protein